MLKCISLKTGAEISLPPYTALCLGNFDGVHLGHQALLAATKQLRDEKYPAAACGVFTFEIPSGTFLSKQSKGLLCTRKEQIELFTQAGMEILVTVDFPSVKNYAPEHFVKQILQTEANCIAALCGYNFYFGKDRIGTPKTLLELFDGNGRILPEYTVAAEPVSSTAIREALTKGEPQTAARLLGRPYSITGEVVHGKALGRSIGIPTVNQNFPAERLLPKIGVYLTDVQVEGKTYVGVTNLGYNPTVSEEKNICCETHLLDFSGNLYGKRLKLEFLAYLRAEEKFSSVEELKQAMEKDCENASRLWEKIARRP